MYICDIVYGQLRNVFYLESAGNTSTSTEPGSNEGTTEPTVTNNKLPSQPQEEVWKRKLKSHWDYLLKTLNVKEIVNSLWQNEVIRDDEKALIENE